MMESLALGIMPRHFLRRGIRTHNEIPRALGIMRPHHRTHPVGVTTREKALILWNQGFFVYTCIFQEGIKSEKSHVFETHVASQWYRGFRTYCADASAEAAVASADAAPSAEALGLSDGTGEADAVPGARRTIRHVPSW